MTAMLPLLIALAAQSTAAPRAEDVRILPGELLRTYVTRGDYPAEAIANRQQGSTTFEVIIGPDGRVRTCEILRSSGHPLLDAQTCSIMHTRLRFTPARDAAGNPAEDRMRSTLGWRLD